MSGRILVDARSLQDRSALRGIGSYVRGLLRGLATIGVGGDIELLLRRGDTPPTAELEGLAVSAARLRSVNRHLQPLFDPVQLLGALRRARPALYHGVDYAQPLRTATPVVVTVHDLIPFLLRDQYRWLRRERRLALSQLARADAVIADSHSTAQDVLTMTTVDPQRVTVVHLGVSAPGAVAPELLDDVRRRHALPPRFLLAVGTFDPRKRVEALADVVARVRRDHDVGLVIAGDQGAFADAVGGALHAAGPAAMTRVLGHVSADDLDSLYRLAECLVFTSSYEGFGLPPLEAMARGTPAAVFDNSSLPEVVGSSALLVPDGDTEAMATAISALLADPPSLARHGERALEWARQFTWERTASETVAVYNAVLNR